MSRSRGEMTMVPVGRDHERAHDFLSCNGSLSDRRRIARIFVAFNTGRKISAGFQPVPRPTNKRSPLSVPVAVLARVVVDAAKDPTSHNLWPLEFIIAAPHQPQR